MGECWRERIDMAVFGAVPDFVRVSLRLRAIEPARCAGRAAVLLGRSAEAVRRSFRSEDPRLAVWRDAYERVGLGSDAVPPQEALAAWASTSTGVPSQGALNDLVNAFALEHMLPAAAYELSAVRGDLWLRPSRGIERFEPLDGRPPEMPPIGELVLADSADLVLARRWHGAQGRATVAGAAASDALVHLDLLPPLAEGAAGLGDAFLRLALECLGGDGEIRLLAHATPQTAWSAGGAPQ